MSKYFTLILIIVSVFSIGCDKQQTGKMATLIGGTGDTVVDDTTSIVEFTTDTPVETEPADEDDDIIKPQIVTVVVSNTSTTSPYNIKLEGFPETYVEEEVKTVGEVTLKVVKTFTKIPILRPIKLEGYFFLPFKDPNGNSTIEPGDQIEIIQHETDKPYFRILRNLTRPEVDYSAFW